MKFRSSRFAAVRSSWLLLIASALSLMLMLAAPAHATFPGQNGRIVFSDLEPSSGDRSIFTLNPDGSGLNRLTGQGPEDSYPAWSADGRKILYNSSIGGLRLMNFDGSGNRPIGDGAQPAWSPDGAKIAVVRSSAGGTAIWVMNADGTGATQLTPPTLVQASAPDWSPDGSKLALGGTTASGGSDIYTIQPDGTQLSNLTNNPSASNGAPSWSPDGSKIVFARSLGQITVMNSDGTSPTAIASTGSSPVWSPDGTRIVYFRNAPNHTMRTIDPNGGNDALVATSTAFGSGLDWQPCQGGCPTSTPTPYDTPAASNVIVFRLVPFFRQTISNSQCLARGGTNSSHGPPLSFSSCSPISYQPGSVARVGPNAEGGVTYRMLPGSFSNIYGTTIEFAGGITDIRTATGADYPAQATLVTRMRVTDRFNGPDLDMAATTKDFDFSVAMGCSPDPDPDFGSTCGVTTNAQAFFPEAFRGDRQSVLQIFGMRVYDSGVNGTRGDADDRIFAGQGIYIP